MNNLLTSVSRIIPVVNSNKSYWFVRSEGGRHFDLFKEREVVCIGHNEITAQNWSDICSASRLEHERRIELRKLIDAKYSGQDERKKNKAYRQLENFCVNMKTGDMIVVPSKASRSLLIGHLVNDEVGTQDFRDDKDQRLCQHDKSRKVNWIGRISKYDASSVLYKEFFSQHAILNLTDHAVELESSVNEMFCYQDKYYFIQNITKNDGIDARLLLDYLRQLLDINDKAIGIDTKYFIRTELNSPGYVKIVMTLPIAAASIWILSSAISGGNYNVDVLGAKANGDSRGLVSAYCEYVKTRAEAAAIERTALMRSELEISPTVQLKNIAEKDQIVLQNEGLTRR